MNIRKGAPSVLAPIAEKVGAGVRLVVTGVVTGEPVHGNPNWYRGENDTYFWSGATVQLENQGTASSISVSRRPNGTIKPLSEEERSAVFGRFDYREGIGGRIEIAKSWVDANLVSVPIPALERHGVGSIVVHQRAADPFRRVFARISDANLSDRVLAFDGTWVARHKNWDTSRGLSSHSWGIAIDLNMRWNGMGVMPPAIGAHGSLRELVFHFEAEGFAWGGHFIPNSSCDGMHFELARQDV